MSTPIYFINVTLTLIFDWLVRLFDPELTKSELWPINDWKRIGCLISTLVTAALALKHQAISTHSAEQVLTVLDQFHKNMLDTQQTNLETDITFLKKLPTHLRVKQQY